MISVDKQIAIDISKANGVPLSKLGLRFDKVVVRILENIRTSIEQVVPNEKTVLLTITAAIKLPAKTEYEIVKEVGNLLNSTTWYKDKRLTILQNRVRLRIVEASSKKTVRFVGLVHNANIDSKLLLDFASHWLSPKY